jgi:hypothetical protein
MDDRVAIDVVNTSHDAFLEFMQDADPDIHA